MNYDEVKELVKNKWEDGKYGDDYRNYVLQTDNFLNHLKQEDSPLQWFPLEEMSEDEMVEFILTYLKRKEANRLLLNNLNHRGIKYDYSDLIVIDPQHEIEMNQIYAITPQLRDFKKLRITDLLEEINIVLVGARYEGYMHSANLLLKYIDLIMYEIMDEKKLFLCMGLDFRNTDYIEQFIRVCERICFGSLFYFVICNDKIYDKHEILTKFEEKLLVAKKNIQEEIVVAKNRFKGRRKIFFEKKAPAETDDISLYFVQFLNRQAFYAEQDKITDLLIRGQEENYIFFEKPKECKHEKVEEYKKKELKDYLCEDIRVPDYNRKLVETKQAIDYAYEKGSCWATSKDSLDLKIAFRELFIADESYRKQKPVTIIRNILNGDNPSRTQLMFLDAKMTRGFFREKSMLQEYEVYQRICSLTRAMFLQPYSAINDEEAYRLVHRCCFEFLDLFGEPEYSGIKLE